jgi:SAM-dependent methyltransferase
MSMANQPRFYFDPLQDPIDRFTGLAHLYAKNRPSYPTAAVDWIIAHCGLGPNSILVDVGSGTGISARLFAKRGLQVIGIEPNAEMRVQAEAEPLPTALSAPRYREGRAEQTGLADSWADAVLVAQAFHWFQPDATLREFYRILKLDRWVILLWNERDERDPFTAAFGDVIRTAPGATGIERARGGGEPLLTSPLFQNGERRVFAHEQQLNEEQLLGRAFSASYAPRQPAPAAAFATALRGVFARYQQDGTVHLCYETLAYVAQRKG